MVIDELEARVRAGLPLDARAGARVHAAAQQDGHAIEVVYRVDRNGRYVINHFCDGARIERATLLMLLCGEAACPEASAVRQRWRAFRGGAEPRASARVLPLRVAPLMEEIAIDEAGHLCVLRPASFECRTPCPAGAHAPRVLRKPGWDLFEDGLWIAGGLQLDKATGAAQPRFGTPAHARQWLADHRAKVLRVLDRWRGAGRAGRPDSAPR